MKSATVYAILLLLLLLLLAFAQSAEAQDCANPAGRHLHTVKVAGVERHYIVAVGPEARKIRAPLVFLWHGFGGNAENIAGALTPERDWPEAVVVMPAGLPRVFPGLGPRQRPGWQIAEGEHGDRDLAFFDALLVDVESRYCVDPRRRYSTGFSNGGFFTSLLGCKRGEKLAAIVPVAGGSQGSDCRRALPVRIVHGTRDDVVPFRFARESWAKWTANNRCDEIPEIPALGCVEARGCRAAVTLCAVDGRHNWPWEEGGRVAEFLKGQTLPQAPAQ